MQNLRQLRRRAYSLDSATLTETKNLADEIHRIEKENKRVRLENILYSSYLQRVRSSKMITTYEEYEQRDEGIIPERSRNDIQTVIHAKLPEIARRSSVKKSFVDPSKSISLWSKLAADWRDYIYSPYLRYVEQEQLSIASYELEQMQLDRERMKMNGDLTLNHLDESLQSIKFNEISHEKFNIYIKQNLSRVQHSIDDKRLLNDRTRQMNTVKLNNMWMQSRIRLIDLTIVNLDNLRETMDEIDLNFVRMRKNNYLEMYKNLEETYSRERLSQYPLNENLLKLKRILHEQEEEINRIEENDQFLKQYIEKIDLQIQQIEKENQLIEKENHILRNRIQTTRQVPTITEYAHVLDRTRKLQHEISIWSKRVTIAEVRSFIYKN